ncbi:MAG: hypothetical protein R6W90_07380 [Ignavibacteriaceae bacterium]
MRIKILLLLFTAVILFSAKGFSQSVGANLTIGLPQGEFKENVDRTGWGFSGHFLFLPQTERSPFSIGLNVGFINYGSESRNERFSITIPDVTVDVDRSNNLVNFHVVMQFLFQTGMIKPYVEGLFGGSYLWTETSVKSRGYIDEVASSTNFDDFAWSYGGGGGFLILLSSNDDGDEISSIYLDLKARYLAGSEAEYLKEGSVTLENGYAILHPSKSKTDLLTIHAGVVIEFNSLFAN